MGWYWCQDFLNLCRVRVHWLHQSIWFWFSPFSFLNLTFWRGKEKESSQNFNTTEQRRVGEKFSLWRLFFVFFSMENIELSDVWREKCWVALWTEQGKTNCQHNRTLIFTDVSIFIIDSYIFCIVSYKTIRWDIQAVIYAKQKTFLTTKRTSLIENHKSIWRLLTLLANFFSCSWIWSIFSAIMMILFLRISRNSGSWCAS